MPIHRIHLPFSLILIAGIDPHRDTPVEILHSYLLGNDKYVWHDTTKGWDDQKQTIFAARLSASSIDSLSIPPPRPHYVVQYKNSLIGKHFKMLQQLGVFYVHDLCSPLLFDLWKATGELGAMLWFPEIKNMDTYLVSRNQVSVMFVQDRIYCRLTFKCSLTTSLTSGGW